MRSMLRGKIHRATVTETLLDYEGSITIDRELLDLAGIWVGERVLVADVNNGSRFETYVIEGERSSGVIALNGAAARLVSKEDKVIIMGFELVDRPIKATTVLVDGQNRPIKVYDFPE